MAHTLTFIPSRQSSQLPCALPGHLQFVNVASQRSWQPWPPLLQPHTHLIALPCCNFHHATFRCLLLAPQAKYGVDEVRYTDELADVLAELAPPCLHVLVGGVNSDRWAQWSDPAAGHTCVSLLHNHFGEAVLAGWVKLQCCCAGLLPGVVPCYCHVTPGPACTLMHASAHHLSVCSPTYAAG